MVQAAIAGAAYAALTEVNRAKFHKRCRTCGASPSAWCEGRLGTICEDRGATHRVEYPENSEYRWPDENSDTGYSSVGTGQDWCGSGWCGPSQCRLHWMMRNARIVEM